MVDVFDRASELEQKHRDVAIKAALNRQNENTPPDEHNGIRYCLDCGIDIPTQRLAVNPHAIRCVECQEMKDKRGR